MSNRWRAIPVLLLSAVTLAAQEAAPIYRATTDLVLVDVQVLQLRTRTPAPSLQTKDLRVFEEGAPQEIRTFSRDEYPLSVVLLFDLTESVRGVLKRLAEGAKTALAHFKPEDEVSVMVYAGGAHLVDGFTVDRARTLGGIEKGVAMRLEEPAHFNEAVYRAAMQLRKAANPASRRVVIWLTDNKPNVPFRKMAFPVHTEIEAFRALHEEGVVVAPILMTNPLWDVVGHFAAFSERSYLKQYPPGDANRYAELTGGQSVGMRGKKPEERLTQLIDELRARYTIGYRPSDPQPAGTFRKIRVELAPDSGLRQKKWTVLARQGYYCK